MTLTREESAALRARRDALEAELAEVNHQLMYADCPGEGRCHGCASWCNVCGDVGLVCDDTGHGCDRHFCTECHKPVTDTEDIFDGYGKCNEHAEAIRADDARWEEEQRAKREEWAKEAKARPLHPAFWRNW